MTTATDNVALSDGPAGVATRSGSIRLLVEGWMFKPHSYALVNQQQCLALLRRGDVELFHLNHPTIPMLGDTAVSGLIPYQQEQTLKAIALPRRGMTFDAIYRIGYPYNFGPGPCKTFVFATCERMRVEPGSWTGGDGPVAEVVEKNDITIITPSEWSRRGFLASGVSPDRVAVIPHGVDTDLFKPLPEAERKAERVRLHSDDRFVFLNVSALTGNKNIGAVIEAFSHVVQKHPEALLILKGLDSVYGSDKWLNVELDSIPAYLRWKASKSISYTGATLSSEMLARVYQTADCYVSPYKSEGFNLPVLEASACGLPLIVTDGGPTDEFTHNEFAYTVPSVLADDGGGHQWLKTSARDIEFAMNAAIEVKEFQSWSRHAGPENAKHFTWDIIADRLLSVVTSTLKGKA